MSDLLTTTYHAIGNHGQMYGCISWKYETYTDYCRVYIYWLGEGLTQDTQWSDTYSLTTSATIVGAVKIGSTTKKSWTATASGTRSGYVNNTGYAWFKAGGSESNYYDVTRTTSAQTVTIQVTYTVSGSSALTGTTSFTVPAKAITYTNAKVEDNGTTVIVDGTSATLKWKGTNGTNNSITGYTVQYDSNTVYSGTSTSCTVTLPKYGSNGFTVTATAPYNSPTAQITITRPYKILMQPCAWVRIGGAWQGVDHAYVRIDDVWKELDQNDPFNVRISAAWQDIF